MPEESITTLAPPVERVFVPEIVDLTRYSGLEIGEDLDDWIAFVPDDDIVAVVRRVIADKRDIFQIRGTGINEIVPEMDIAARQLFNGDHAALEREFGHGDRFRQRGFGPYGVEKAEGMDGPDAHKAFWQTGNSRARDGIENPDAEDGKYDDIDIDPVTYSSRFGCLVRRALRFGQRTNRIMLRAVEIVLDLTPGELIKRTIRADDIVRTLCYRTRDLPFGTVLAAEHDDINLTTMIASLNATGFEALIDGVWHQLLKERDTILFNKAEQLAGIDAVDDRIHMVTHRVVVRQGISVPYRIVFAIFCHHIRRMPLVEGGKPAGELFLDRIEEIMQM